MDAAAERSGIGPVAALVVALAAGVVREAARRSDGEWDEASGASAQAGALRNHAVRLAREDLDAHVAASGALRAALERGEGRTAGDAPLAPALARAADLPLEIAEVAVDLAELAALTAEHGTSDLRADAAGAAQLAAGAVAAAEHLIAVNLATGPGDERVARVGQLRVAADAASDRARNASP
ncbi:MAG TPA: cyclodeaminase/cyclohydrolase family protein [Solirubrobacterales bacterium]|nr:cyclodeaminase/cyclohydrolase family protein [Solirubrobacterales bacterium]